MSLRRPQSYFFLDSPLLLAIVTKVYMDGSFTVTVYTYFGTNHVPYRSYVTSTMCSHVVSGLYVAFQKYTLPVRK